MSIEKDLSYKFNKLSHILDEQQLRMLAAVEAKIIGHGGTKIVSEAFLLDPKTIRVGMKEISKKGRKPKFSAISKRKIRKEGGGRKTLIDKDPTLQIDLEKLIDPVTRGDPTSSLKWTSKSLVKLAAELTALGHKVSTQTVYRLLNDMGYSLQSNKKSNEGSNHEDRDAQFSHINDECNCFAEENQPVISVDTKKKELVGNYKNNGKEWEKSGEPLKVNDHDFPDKELGKASPFGIYDINNNNGWVNVGISADTSEFAVESIRRWWKEMGSEQYPNGRKLLITADCGGSNGYRNRLFKSCLQDFSNETNLEISVSHFPPGTSKWNKIEHRMFCHITKNWRGRPLTSLEVIVNSIKATTTKTGLKINAGLDENIYEKGKKISDEDLLKINIERNEFHGEWNYVIKPNIELK